MAGLKDYALCTLGEARAYVLRDETDGSQDTLLTKLINGESKSILRWCARQYPSQTAATKTFTYSGSGYIDFRPFELRNLTSIALLPAGWTTPLTLDPATPDFVLEPAGLTDEGTYLWARLPELDNPGAWPPRAARGMRTKATLVGDWGMTEIPEDVSEGALMCVRWRYKNPDGQQRTQIGDMSISAYSQHGDGVPPFPAEAVSKFDNFARPDVGI